MNDSNGILDYRCSFDCHQTATRKYWDRIRPIWISKAISLHGQQHIYADPWSLRLYQFCSKFSCTPQRSKTIQRGFLHCPGHLVRIHKMAWLATQEADCKRAGPEFSRDTYKLFTVRPVCGWSKDTRKHFTPWVTMKHTSACVNPRARTKHQASHLYGPNPREQLLLPVVEMSRRWMSLFGFGRNGGRLEHTTFDLVQKKKKVILPLNY